MEMPALSAELCIRLQLPAAPGFMQAAFGGLAGPAEIQCALEGTKDIVRLRGW
jgi:hypothetical protein